MSTMKFALMGAAGYVAPRHLQAIKETGNEVVAAFDICDNVGILDNYFPNTSFFKEWELFDRHCTKIKNTSDKVEILSICTPNYLHDAHIRYGLRLGADVICEKPLVLNPWNVEAIQKIEEETGHKVYNILQLRLHKSIQKLKKEVEQGPKDKIYDVDLTYITSRGIWYYVSWKGNEQKSGGIATNIGIHFYDMLTYIFGPVHDNIVHIKSHDRVAGFLALQKARVRYFLSINSKTLPQSIRDKNLSTYRSIKIGSKEIEFSNGFQNLHTESYKQILEGHGFGCEDALNCIQIVHDIRNATPIGLIGDYHPFAKLPLDKYPIGNKR